MIRDLIKRMNNQMISFEEVKRLITSNLGIKPRKGGNPPRENKAMKDRVFVFVLVIDLICLK